MSIRSNIEALAKVVSELEEGWSSDPEFTVNAVEMNDQQLCREDCLSATISLGLPELSWMDVPEQVEVMDSENLRFDDGSIVCDLQVVISCGGNEPTPDQLSPRTSGETTVTSSEPENADASEVSVEGPTNRSLNDSDDSTADATADSGGDEIRRVDTRDAQPYKDPERLREVYEKYETFEDMRDALGVDVSFQTVRRHLIKHGIHEVQSREPKSEPAGDVGPQPVGGAGDAGSPRGDDVVHKSMSDGGKRSSDDCSLSSVVTTTDALDDEALAGLTVSDVQDGLVGSQTLYEVSRSLDLDIETTTELLRQLELIDLVTGRMNSVSAHEVSREEVTERF